MRGQLASKCSSIKKYVKFGLLKTWRIYRMHLNLKYIHNKVLLTPYFIVIFEWSGLETRTFLDNPSLNPPGREVLMETPPRPGLLFVLWHREGLFCEVDLPANENKWKMTRTYSPTKKSQYQTNGITWYHIKWANINPIIWAGIIQNEPILTHLCYWKSSKMSQY